MRRTLYIALVDQIQIVIMACDIGAFGIALAAVTRGHEILAEMEAECRRRAASEGVRLSV